MRKNDNIHVATCIYITVNITVIGSEKISLHIVDQINGFAIWLLEWISIIYKRKHIQKIHICKSTNHRIHVYTTKYYCIRQNTVSTDSIEHCDPSVCLLSQSKRAKLENFT